MKIFSSALLLYMLVSSITPGPNNLTMLFLGARYGFKGTLKFMTGSMLTFLVKGAICGLLNLALADIMPKAVVYLKWVGAAYMVYLGITMALSGFKAEKEAKASGSGADEPRKTSSTLAPTESTYRSGILLQLLNMKSWIAAISIFAVYVIPVDKSLGAILAATFVDFLFLTASSSVWGLFGSAIRSFVDKYRKPFGIICGLSLVYCAVTALL